ncbi:MAG: glycoside hydrolase family 3 protein [Chthoniobacterales bacterium]
MDRAIGQLMMVGFHGPALTSEIRETLTQLHPGGVCLYAHNIIGVEQVARLNDELRSCLDDPLPPFLAVDQEGGVVVRLYDGVTVFPSSMALAATRSARLAFEQGKVVGQELRLLGFNMNLAPVLDGPENLAIGTRAFSDDSRLIAQLGSAFISGQEESEIVTVAKHFPGEGHSHDDGHYTLPVRWDSGANVRAELIPFCAAMEHDLDGILTAHIAVPGLTKNRTPATISAKLLTGVLRDELGFNGLIMTDELEGMRAISGYGVDRAAVAAITAGADIVFVASAPDVQKKVHRALIDAVRSGKISQARLHQALAHIVAAKTKRKIFDPLPAVEQRLSALHSTGGSNVAKQIAEKSITTLGHGSGCLPIDPNRRLALVTDSKNFADAVRARVPRTTVLMVDKTSLRNRAATQRSIRSLAANADAMIAAFILQDRFELVRPRPSPSLPLVLLLMNVPSSEFLRDHPDADGVLANYSYQRVSAEAAAAVMFENPITPGLLPVRLDPSDARGATVTAE